MFFRVAPSAQYRKISPSCGTDMARNVTVLGGAVAEAKALESVFVVMSLPVAPGGRRWVNYPTIRVVESAAMAISNDVEVPSNFDESVGLDAVRAFIDDDWSAIMVKVVSGLDPVEMTPLEARRLSAALLLLAEELDAHDA
jgi:hypothetical protein